MASLYKRNGHYYLSFFDSRRRPKTKQIALKTAHKSIALKRQRECEIAFEKGEFDPWNTASETKLSGSLDEAIQAFISTRSNLSSQTVAKYRPVLGLLERQLGEGVRVERITTNDIQIFLDSGQREAIVHAIEIEASRIPYVSTGTRLWLIP